MKRFGIILAVILILGLSSSIGQARPLGQQITVLCKVNQPYPVTWGIIYVDVASCLGAGVTPLSLEIIVEAWVNGHVMNVCFYSPYSCKSDTEWINGGGINYVYHHRAFNLLDPYIYFDTSTSSTNGLPISGYYHYSLKYTLPTPAVSFLANPGYDFTYGPTPGYEPVNNSNYSVSYFPKNLLLPAAVTTTEGFFVPDISCNQPPAGGALCQNYDGDRVISPTRLVDLCNVGAVSIVQSYVVALEPACNGSQFRNAQLINFATGQRVDCTSAMPKCWLVANDLDELAMTVDLDNDVAGVDYRLRTYVLRGGPDDFIIVGLQSIFSTLFFVFLHANKTEAFGRGLIFFVCYLVYFVAGGSPTQVSRLYYFYLFFEAGFSLLWFARYKLFLAKVRK